VVELTIDQALQQAVEAHKAGQAQEADRLYTAIIKAQPQHPDANHNMGILAVGVDKVQEALPFFKTALETNPNIAQFWFSYIDALIKLDKLEDAKAVLDRAKRKGAKGDGFNKLEQQLNEADKVQEPPQAQIQELINLYSRGQLQQALKRAETLVQKFPKSPVLFNIQGAALKGVGQLDASVKAYNKALAIKPDYAEAYYNMGVTLKDQGKQAEAIEAYKKALAIKPDYADAYNNMGVTFHDQGKQVEAIEAYKKALAIKPDYADAYNNMGNALKDQDKSDVAIDAFNKALAIKPDYAEAYNNMGNALKEQGKLEEAIEAYNKALAIKPDYAETYYNMGVTLQEQGKLEEAIEAYNKALAIKPDSAEIYNNIGNGLQDQGKLEEAIEAYNKALAIKPDYAEAYNNMGNALQYRGKLEEAIEAYNKALAIKPDHAEAFWNLSGTTNNTLEAKDWIEHCLSADSKHEKARLTLCALQFYEGDKSEFNALMQSSLREHPYMRSFAWAFELPVLPELYFHRWALFDRMVEQSQQDRPFYEYGVWRGEAFQYLIKTFKKGYGFDTFEGIPEDWHDEKAGTYSSDGNIPQIGGGEFIVGKFEDTLPKFFSEPRPKASIINFDADLYSSTICALNFSKAVIDRHTILIFDEFIINKNWEQDEYKALNEFCVTNNCTYEVLAISFFTKQAAIKLIGI
jgi:tetratricopeptide (TPR) repeat protein